jgi:hypothetical protein
MSAEIAEHPRSKRRIEVNEIAGSFVVHVCPRGPHHGLTKFFGDGELVPAMLYADQISRDHGWPVIARPLRGDGSAT